jgi:hypothetical protein
MDGNKGTTVADVDDKGVCAYVETGEYVGNLCIFHSVCLLISKTAFEKESL